MIYFVRHGQTDDNKNHILQGNKGLNEIGKSQVEQTAKILQNVNFDICFCSPLKRTIETLEIILKYHNNLNVVYDERLKERSYGDLVGICYDTISLYSKTRWSNNCCIHKTVEYPNQVYNRVAEFYEEILPKYKGKNILIVGHSGIARMTYFYFKGKPENDDYTDFEIKNAHIMEIEN